MKKLLTQTIVLTGALMITSGVLAQSPTATRQRRTAAEAAQPAITIAAPTSTPPSTPTSTPSSTPVSTSVSTPTSTPSSTPMSTLTGPQASTTAAVTAPADVKADAQTKPVDQSADEDAIVQSYNNFFSTYKLGPEDIISINVFGQDRYSRSGIKIPPSGRISLALIPDGIFVNGKTVDQVSELIRKRYDEYILTPQVSVSLDQAGSYRYSVIGDVGQPGIRLMTRRLSVTEAIAEAGGILQTGDKKKVYVLRKQANGNLQPIPVNVAAIYRGQAPDSIYLNPGDQVVVPGNRWKTFDKISGFLPILSFARIFAGGF